eukprot:CAMPEP_0175047616 /NCGR_PEP_ID=MMETSP0052_2-20121109/5703_1 /TAXON_ID=51329 ORGANISM="Polytomella parva, Strain SAG 63-3" /NCGR_SAMPLE_ID=MMETSP0052_2 /ASSEMBLY_ACC=CAM_ASM_000194 /LENGTH=665 /DNA_ID=CAMNT_0016311529 /DNA_START=559 /DNA_END=2553 /DNA_ORIENTATION=-
MAYMVSTKAPAPFTLTSIPPRPSASSSFHALSTPASSVIDSAYSERVPLSLPLALNATNVSFDVSSPQRVLFEAHEGHVALRREGEGEGEGEGGGEGGQQRSANLHPKTQDPNPLSNKSMFSNARGMGKLKRQIARLSASFASSSVLRASSTSKKRDPIELAVDASTTIPTPTPTHLVTLLPSPPPSQATSTPATSAFGGGGKDTHTSSAVSSMKSRDNRDNRDNKGDRDNADDSDNTNDSDNTDDNIDSRDNGNNNNIGGKSAGTSNSAAKSVSVKKTNLGGAGSLQGSKFLHSLFYVFVHVENLVVMSAMWTRCADSFSPEMATRLFGVISAGATVGQLTGSLLTMTLASASSSRSGVGGTDSTSSPLGMPAYQLILLSAVLLFAAAFLQTYIKKPQPLSTALAGFNPKSFGPNSDRISYKYGEQIPKFGSNQATSDNAVSDNHYSNTTLPSGDGSNPNITNHPHRKSELHESGIQQAIGSIKLVLASPYLFSIASYLLLTYVTGSLLYFQRAQVVGASISTRGRATFFARIYSLSGTTVLILQLFVTGRVLQWLPMHLVLASFPAVCGGGAVLIAGSGSPNAVVVVEVVRKIVGYSLIRPAREVLFTVVSREDKWRAKVTLDTIVQRLGDSVAAAIFQVMNGAPAVGRLGVVAATCFVSIIW